MRRLSALLCATIVVLSAAFLALPRFTPRILAWIGSRLHLEISISRAELSIVRGVVALFDLRVAKRLEPGGAAETLLWAPRLTAAVDLAELARGLLRVRSIQLPYLKLHGEVGPDGRSTLDRVLEDAPCLAEALRYGGTLSRALVDQAEVGEATVEFQDLAREGSPVLRATFRCRLETQPASGLLIQLAGAIYGVARSFHAVGRAAALPGGMLELEGSAKVEGLSLGLFDREPGASGRLADGLVLLDAAARLVPAGEGVGIEAEVRRLRIEEGGRPLALLGGLRLRAPRLDELQRIFVIRQVEAHDVLVCLERDRAGRVTAAGFALRSPETLAAWAGRLPSWLKRGYSVLYRWAGKYPRRISPGPGTGAAQPEAVAARLQLENLALENVALEWRDRAVTPAVETRLRVPRLQVDHLRWPELEEAAQVSGSAALDGILGSLEFSARIAHQDDARAIEGRLALAGLALEVLAPYRPCGLPAAVENVSVSADIALHLVEERSGALRGEIWLSRFLARDAEDTLGSIESGKISARRIAPAEGRYDLESVEVRQPDFSIVRRLDGRLGFLGFLSDGTLDLFRRVEAAPRTDAASGAREAAIEPRRACALPLASVDRLRVEGGRLHVRDEAVRPAVSLEVEELRGVARGLTTAGFCGTPAPPATFSVRFGIAEVAESVEVEGALDLGPDLDGEIGLRCREVQLVPLSPYLAAVSNVTFEAGCASLRSTISLRGPRFESENLFTARDLEFGGREAESRLLGGTRPISLALCARLLRDERGLVELRIPVSGERGVPSVEVLALAGRAFTRAMSASLQRIFAPLAHLFEPRRARGPRFRPIVFAPGSAEIGPDSRARLEELARQLEREREVVLELRGSADPSSDLPPALLFRATLERSELRDHEPPRLLCSLHERRVELSAAPGGQDRLFLRGGRGWLSGRLEGAADGRLLFRTTRADPVSVDPSEVAWLRAGTEQGRRLLDTAPELREFRERRDSEIAAIERAIEEVRREMVRARLETPAEFDRAARAARREAREALAALASARAEAVRADLLARGIGPSRVEVGMPNVRAPRPSAGQAPWEEPTERTVEVGLRRAND